MSKPYYDRRDDPNEGIVSVFMTLGQFLVSVLLSLIIIFLVVGYSAMRTHG